MVNPHSPFTQTNLQPLGIYSKRGAHQAIKFADGTINVNFNDATAFHVLKAIASALNAEVIVVKGTWTFTPDAIEKAEENG